MRGLDHDGTIRAASARHLEPDGDRFPGKEMDEPRDLAPEVPSEAGSQLIIRTTWSPRHRTTR